MRSCPPASALALVLALAAGFGCQASAERDLVGVEELRADELGPNDVSILWPIAADRSLTPGHLRLAPETGRGPAFPIAELRNGTFPQILQQQPIETLVKGMTVVATRVKVCGATQSPDECTPQLRLVAQAMGENLAGMAAIHVIYRLTENEVDALVADLATWRSHSPVPTGRRLAVHPGLAAAGVDSAYGHELGEIVLRYATDAALTRVTFNAFANTEWTFSQFDRGVDPNAPARWQPTQLPTLPRGSHSQVLTIEPLLFEPEATIAKANPPLSLDVSPLLRNELEGPLDRPALLAARDAIHAYQSPTSTTSDTTDCAGCHFAGPLRGRVEAMGVSFASGPSYVVPPWMDSTGIDETDGLNTILFGYRDDFSHASVLPSIGRRVVNETADTLVHLRERHR